MGRYEDAKAYYEASMERVRTTPPPKGQKFPPGARVKIADDLGPYMAHFISGVEAVVDHTYAHAYGGSNVDDYSLLIDGSPHAWYHEHQLTLIEEP